MDKAQAGKQIWTIDGAHAARWVFPARSDDRVNQIVDFWHCFECDRPAPDAELLISADTDFVVWLNGQLVGHGQFSNYPDRKTYERFVLGSALREGNNKLAVTVFYNGRNSSVYRRGDPGLLFEVRAQKTLASSGTDTLSRPNRCYHSGPIAIVSRQLIFTFGYDACGDDGFNREDYTPGPDWKPITESEATLPALRRTLLPRPVSRLVDGGGTEATLVAAGRFQRDTALIETKHGALAAAESLTGLELADGTIVSCAWLMQHDTLSEDVTRDIAGVWPGAPLRALRIAEDLPENYDGIYLRFDLGCEEVGYLTLDIDAPAGTIVDVGYGEHLEDGRVRTFVGSRNFAARYICREGRQSFTHHFLRWAGRYLELRVHTGSFTLHGLGLQRRDYPVAASGRFDSENALHHELLRVGGRTLQLCMHEHYEDTPWREQALYANDARTQALCGYYAFGETAMPASSFALLGQSKRDDGFLFLTAPAFPPVTIPSFTLVWMLAVRDHYLYSGDDSLARAFLPQIVDMLNEYLSERQDGLWPLRRKEGVWHFYDWSAGMSGYSDEHFDKGLITDAPLNCFLILALDATCQMLDWCGDKDTNGFAGIAENLRQCVADRFWDPAQKIFLTHEREETLTELTQALAVLAGVGTTAQRECVLERMSRPDSGLAKPGLSQSFYTFEALMTRKDLYGAGVLAGIEQTWGKMLADGATAFWETEKGASDFGGAGSLCHGWSAVPVYVLYHDVLGVRPLEPGFRTFAVDPMVNVRGVLGGRVPVPGGEIVLQWRGLNGEVTVTVDAPDQLRQIGCGR